MKCTIDKISGNAAHCWSDLDEIFRLKFSVPLDKISHLSLSMGDEFEWDSDNQIASLVAVNEINDRQKIKEFIDELSKEYEANKAIKASPGKNNQVKVFV